ncbi:hypothetical protein RND81_08G194200 [Saponaria officinalis]|uniref:Serine aminopeptidase S33 domain-containing protein n=1 Tax=Saponaria officinalis TaxID=3572 RepID=A0AAW1JAE9_SAPOF
MVDRQPSNSNSNHENQNISHFGVERKVVVSNSHGEKLVGILHETGSKDLVIVCHGIKSSKEQIPMVSLAAALGEIGNSAFRFDFAGNGESEGSFRYGNYRREAEDLRAVVQHFRGIGYVINTIIGHSKGGNVVLLYASKYHDVSRVVNISGRFDLRKGIEGRLGKNFLERIKRDGYIDVYSKKGKFQYCVTEESLLDRLSTDMRGACHLIRKNCRILTVHGSMDPIVSVEDASEFDRVIDNHTLRIIEGADHEFTLHQDELVSVVLDFVRDEPRGDHMTKRSSSPAYSPSSGSSKL